MPVSDLSQLDAQTRSRLFAVVSYAASESRASTGGLDINVPLTQLNAQPLAELWLSPEPVDAGSHDNLSYTRNEQVLFGSVPLGSGPNLQEDAYDAYRSITSLLEKLGYSALLRTWNYFPDINALSHDIERYKQFCLGRQQAYDEFERLKDRNFPAATVIGTHRDIGDTGVIYFIAAREDGLAIENPRQTSAYHYPDQYGPVSPAFSRSICKQWNDQAITFISGTASIVGHESRHPGDCPKQTEEILSNLAQLMQSVSSRTQTDNKVENISRLKVYLRNPRDLQTVKARLDHLLGSAREILYLHGDICRTDLLIEMEGISHAGLVPE